MRNLLQRAETFFFSVFLLLLPTQLGKHFWPNFSIVSGIRVDYLSPTVYLTDLLIISIFIVWFLRIAKSAIFKTVNVRYVILLFGFFTFNIYFSQNFLNGMVHLLKFLELSFLAYYIATVVKNVEQMKKIFFLLAIGAIAESVLAIAQFLKQGSIGGILYFLGERSFTGATPGIANASINGELILRPYATFPHPNVLAGYLVCVLVALLFSLPWTKRRDEKLVWTTALLLGSSALLLTLSRVANALWIVLLAVVFLQQIRSKRIAVTAAALFIVLGITLLSTPVGARFLQTSLTEEAVVQRVALIQSSAQLFTSHPVLGVGFGNFIPSLSQVQKPVSLSLYLQPVHNIFLLVLVETGIIGFGVFIWFLVKTYKQLFMKIQKTGSLPYRIFVVVLSIVFVLGSVDHYFLTIQQGQLLFALLLGLPWTQLKD